MPRHNTLRKLFLQMAALALLATGCAAPLLPGATREEALARYGRPTRVVALDAGTRLQYSGQPAAQSALMVDLDASGRVTAVREVMNPVGFARVVPNRSTREDVERELGRPASVDGVGSWSGDIMTYRWRDTGFDMFFWVYLDGGGVVRRTGQGMEIRNKGFDD